MWRWLIQSAAIVACAAACSNSNGTGGQAGSPLPSSAPPTKAAKHHDDRHRAARRDRRHHHRRSTLPRGVPAADVPRPSLTPGAALAVGKGRICVSGYSASVRNVPTSESDQVYAEYGVTHVPYAHEVDHLISLELGGSNSIRNLWPEPYAGRWGARAKDVLENQLHDLVCSGSLALRKAQHQEATNWVAAYRRYIGATPSGSGGSSGSSGGSTSTGGYYLSSYPSASTIYCADDSAWRGLSKTYLRHYATFAAAHRAYPSYHLHQPC